MEKRLLLLTQNRRCPPVCAVTPCPGPAARTAGLGSQDEPRNQEVGRRWVFISQELLLDALSDPLLPENLRWRRWDTSCPTATAMAAWALCNPALLGSARNRAEKGEHRRTSENNGSKYLSGSHPEPHRKRRRFYRRDACPWPRILPAPLS